MLLTDGEYQDRLVELQKLHITLDSDPVATGLSSINKKIAEIQGVKDRIGQFLLEAIKNKNEADIVFETEKNSMERQLDNLLIKDPEVQNQKSEKMRTSMANTKMPETMLKIHFAEMDKMKSDNYYKCVQQVYSNLESTNSNLSRQISVIQMGIDVGEISRSELQGLMPKTLSVKTN